MDEIVKVESSALRKRGRPRKQTPRESIPHEPTRAASRGGATVQGRNGEILTRKRTGTADPFQVNPGEIPKGWEYQWNAISVVGNTEILMDQNLQMAENGWRPVPAEGHPGRYMPEGHTGSIIRGGLRLDERPTKLCEEARAENLRAAHQLISDRNESLKLSGVKDKLGSGFEMSRKYRGTGGDIRMSIDASLDGSIPRPQHKVAE